MRLRRSQVLIRPYGWPQREGDTRDRCYHPSFELMSKQEMMKDDVTFTITEQDKLQSCLY